jgi:Zn-dependent M28 family amino/carboxypeptidase
VQLLVLALGLGCRVRAGSEEASAGAEATSTCIDGSRALAHVREIVAFGPRHAGSDGIRATRRYILDSLRELGLEPTEQDFIVETSDPVFAQVAMVNVLVDLPGESKHTVILGGHYDGKLVPGRDFIGANDGGSSAGLLLEMARCLAEEPPRATVRIAFIDGEESVGESGPGAGLYGSDELATTMRKKGEIETVAAAIIVDMIGDRRLRISREVRSTEWLWQLIDEQARSLGLERYFAGPPLSVIDDHTPLLRAGIPSVLLIDLHYGPGWEDNSYWHTEQDTVDKLSARSFEIVGSVLLASIDEISSGLAD